MMRSAGSICASQSLRFLPKPSDEPCQLETLFQAAATNEDFLKSARMIDDVVGKMHEDFVNDEQFLKVRRGERHTCCPRTHV